VPLFEFVLRRPGQADEIAITDHDGCNVGDEITMRDQQWLVTDIDTHPDGPVTERITVEPKQ
jgi:hypothetical protein